MHNFKTKSLLLSLLCLFISMVVKADDFVKPEITDESEVCIFLISPDEATYTFHGYGGDYSTPTAWPGDTFVEVGQQEDGSYLYKWSRPAGATGIPGNFTLSKNYKTDDDKIGDPSFSNHGIYMIQTEQKTTDVTAQDASKTVTHVKTGTDDPLASLDTEGEHSIFFETNVPSENYYLWAYDGSHGGEYYSASGKWPGDKLTALGTLDNGNTLYKWTQTQNTDDTPTSFSITETTNGENKLYADKPYVNNGYFVRTRTVNANVTTVHQIGRAYPSVDAKTSDLDPQAYLSTPNEVSVFLESPKENADYRIWPYDDANGRTGTYFTGEPDFPGAKLSFVGQLANGHYLYKWTQDSHITDLPARFILNEGETENKILDGVQFENHGYYTVTYDESKKATVTYKEPVTRQADGSYATSRTTFGQRVIYELNVGSFTTEGTFNAAKERLSYLKNLGVDVIWIMPIWERGGGENPNHLSPYAVKDYSKINPNYGSEADLKSLVDQAHSLSMDVWLDFVPNHTSTDNAWVTEHPEYYTTVNGKMVHPASDGKFYTDDQTAPDGVIVYRDVYQLDYTSEKTVTDDQGNATDVYNPADRAIRESLEYWANATDIDGYRFDMVSSKAIPSSVWTHLTTSLKAIKPSMQFLAEADFTRDQTANPSDFQYDYAWGFNDILQAQGKNETTYQDIDEKTNPSSNPVDFTHKAANYLNAIKNVNTDPMFYLINHDINNTKSTNDIWGDNRYAMTVMEFTLPGMPLIYNGQEQNGTQKLGYFADTKVDWANTRDNYMQGLIRELSYLKHTNNAINDGTTQAQRGETHILNSYEHTVFAYERIKGDQHIIVVLNLSNTIKSPQILGATKGTWKRILKGNNRELDNTNPTETIGDSWNLNDVPANGFEIFTYSGESNKETKGIYLVADDSWNNPTAHLMTPSGSDDNYNYYRFEINGSDFNAMSTEEGQTEPGEDLKFKIQEFYDFLDLGTICKTDHEFSSKADVNAQFTDGGTKEFDAVTGSQTKENAFSIKADPTNITKFIITFARSKATPTEGKVSLEIVHNNDIQSGYYLITPSNIDSQSAAERHKWRFNYASEDPNAVGDKYMTELSEDKRDLVSYVIDASQFDSYIPANRKASNTIQFRIRQYNATTSKDNQGDIDPKMEDKENDKSTFDGSKGDYVYDNAYWQAYHDNEGKVFNDAYFKILYQPDVSKYIIQCWQTGEGSKGATRVRVYYVRKYNYTGSTIQAVSASNEDVYLYNVDAQKFLYVGNTWGTMASLLYDDLGTRLNISEGVTDENTDYKLIRTRMDGAGIVPDGTMLGIDDFGYNAKDADPFNRLDSANLYCDRNNGNRWIFEKADSIDYANTYTLKLFNKKDGRFHYMVADHSDTDKAKNTQVKYIAIDDKKYSAADLDNMGALQGKATPSPAKNNRHYIGYVGENNGSIKFDYNTSFTGTYDISIDYLTRDARKLNINVGTPDGKNTDYEQTSGTTGSNTNYNRTETMHYTVNMQKGTNNITIGEQADAAPNIAGVSITLKRPADLTYGRWQLVTFNDLYAKLKNDNANLYGGTSADATFLLTDQGFTRNVTVSWNTDKGQKILDGSNATSDVAFTKNAIGANPASGMYWNAHITGKGCVYQDIEVPMYGIYQFDAYGFNSGSKTQMYYQYATDFNADGSVKTWSDMLGRTALKDTTLTYTDRMTDVNTGTLFYNESVLGNNPEHKTTVFINLPQNTTGKYILRIGFYKTGENIVNGKDQDYTAVDDVHLHYIGKSPFILHDNWTSDAKTTAFDKDKREGVPVYIEREFWANKWNALVLPVSVSTATLRAMFGDGVQVATPYGLDDNDGKLIRFTLVNLSQGSTAIEAGKFYIVRPEKLVGTSKVMVLGENNSASDVTAGTGASDANRYKYQFFNLGLHDLNKMVPTVDKLDLNSIGFHAASEKDDKHPNTIQIIGAYNKMTAPAGTYLFASDGNMYHIATEHEIKGFRFYIEDVDKNSTAKSIGFGSLSDDLDAVLSGYDNDDNKGTATEIQGVSINNNDDATSSNGDVYDVSGRRVAVNGQTENLPSGVYIINGKKYIKK